MKKPGNINSQRQVSGHQLVRCSLLINCPFISCNHHTWLAIFDDKSVTVIGDLWLEYMICELASHGFEFRKSQ